MEYIIIDLEFNQPFQFSSAAKTELEPKCPCEIIQIGAVKMDEAFNILDAKGFLVKPTLYKRLHPYVERITGITAEKLSDKPVFSDVYAEFAAFVGSADNVLGFWGSGDIKELCRNVLYYSLDESCMPKTYINVQRLASRHLNKPSGTHIGLKNAVTELNITADSLFHDALNDALYTAEVLKLVHSDDMPVHQYDMQSFAVTEKPEPESTGKLNCGALYRMVEKELGRRLSRKERFVARKIYDMGRARMFDKHRADSKDDPAVDVTAVNEPAETV